MIGQHHDGWSGHVCQYQRGGQSVSRWSDSNVVSGHYESFRSFETVGALGNQGSGSRVHCKVRVRAVCMKSAVILAE